MKNNILICLEKLGIGGVETAVVNQAIALSKKGYNVFVISEKGLYSKTLEDNGIKWIEYKFELENRFDNIKINNMIKILKENQIGQVIIHQYPCILQLWYACAVLKIPYIAYIHSGTQQIYQWYEKNYKIYSNLLKAFFENAHKIIAVSQMGKDSNKEYYGIDDEKYLVLKNSINFDEYKSDKKTTQIKNFIILARIASEKMVSIKNAIDLFIRYSNKTGDSDLVLNIYGEGPDKEKLEKYIEEINQDKKYNINLCGATYNVRDVIEQHDVVMAIGRCILEAIAMKRVAIISGNSGDEPLKFIVKSTNIDEAIEQNFSGNILKKENIDDIIKELQDLDETSIEKLVEHNYKVIYEKLNINDNVYVMQEDYKDNTDYDKILHLIFEEQNKIIDEARQCSDKLEKENEDLKTEINKDKEEKEKAIEENEKLREEINNIYNSKRWKLMNRITKLINK